ncbi:MAG: hypothetical protein NTZ59_07240 [Bacteroidetes bacterium]|nr:hypothetical protein [Bacteroidota bacterium]
MKIKTTVLVVFLFITSLLQAQKLQRKGSLGIGLYTNTPDSVIQKLHYTTGCALAYSQMI